MSNQTGNFYKDNLIDTRNKLVEFLYVDLGMSLTHIAFIFKISKQMVSKIISKNNK